MRSLQGIVKPLSHFWQFTAASVIILAALAALSACADLKRKPCTVRHANARCGCPKFMKPSEFSLTIGLKSPPNNGNTTAGKNSSTQQQPPPTQTTATATSEEDESEVSIEKDEEGVLYYVVDDMVFRRRPTVEADDQPLQQSGDTPSPLNILFWPGGLIFYRIDRSFSKEYRAKIRDAMISIESNVGRNHLEFREVITANGNICRRSYVYVTRVHKKQCRAEVGMQTKETRVWLNEDSCLPGTIQHELLHALGRYHEQCRPDRDKYVDLIPQAMISSECGNYDKIPALKPSDPTLEHEYDSFSIMHYGSCFFTCDGRYTMLRKDGSVIQENRLSMTQLDVAKLRSMFPAIAKVPYSEKHCQENPRGGSGRGRDRNDGCCSALFSCQDSVQLVLLLAAGTLLAIGQLPLHI